MLTNILDVAFIDIDDISFINSYYQPLLGYITEITEKSGKVLKFHFNSETDLKRFCAEIYRKQNKLDACETSVEAHTNITLSWIGSMADLH